ncbi:MAG: hypothetical protein HRU34_11930 [Richelia sp.]|nr:hypothetical protein [Richelia sp.]
MTPNSPNSSDTISPTNTKIPTTKVVQNLLPGIATRGARSYIGIGANIGISGDDSSLGDGNFAVLSKIGLGATLLVRRGVELRQVLEEVEG